MKLNKKGAGLKSLIIMLIVMVILIIIHFSIGSDLYGRSKEVMKIGDGPCKCGQSLLTDDLIEHEGVDYCVHSRAQCTINLDKNTFKTIDYIREEGNEPVPLCVYTPSACEAFLKR
jgi:hypothetical protein